MLLKDGMAAPFLKLLNKLYKELTSWQKRFKDLESGGLEEGKEALAKRVEGIAPAVKEIELAGEKVAVLFDSYSLLPPKIGFSNRLGFMARQLRGFPGYPLIVVDVRSAENVDRYRKEGFRVLSIFPDIGSGLASWDIVYLKMQGRIIPREHLPLIVTEALALWKRAQGAARPYRIILDSAPYFEIKGIRSEDIWEVLQNTFA